jgi:hypothetical protein
MFHVLNNTDLLCVGYILDSSFAVHISVREGAAGLLGTTFIRGYDYGANLYNLKAEAHFELRKSG